MHILLANFHNKGYGQPTAVFLLARALHKRGHTVTVATPPGSVLAERSEQAGLTTFTKAYFRTLKHVLSLRRDVSALRARLRTAPPDIIHTNGSQDTWMLALARRPLRPRIPMVMSRHNSKSVHTGLVNRWLYGKALDHLILTSSAIRTHYQPLLERQVISENRMTTIHPPFDLDMFDRTYDRNLLHQEIGLPNNTPILGIVGRLHGDKGHKVLLKALPRILASHPTVHTVFAGDGGGEQEYRALAKELGVDSRLTFLGFRRDIAEVTASLTISVLPTTGTDSSPTVLKEALCLGIPVVAADTGGVREVIDDGETGYVVARHDHDGLATAIIRLLDDPQRACAMAQEGARRVRERFSPEACAHNHERLYESLLRSMPR